MRALAPVVLPIGTGDRQVQAIRRGQGKSDLLAISPATEQWLRQGYEARMNTHAVRRDLGPILAHGEPETGMGQGEAAEADQPAPRRPQPGPRHRRLPTGRRGGWQRRGNGGLRRPRTRRCMNSAARSRLAAQAAAAGYPPDVLALIADATLPAHRPDSRSKTHRSNRSPTRSRSSPRPATPPRTSPPSSPTINAATASTGAGDSGPRAAGSPPSATATRTATGSRPARPTPTGSPRTPTTTPRDRRGRHAPPEPFSRTERSSR